VPGWADCNAHPAAALQKGSGMKARTQAKVAAVPIVGLPPKDEWERFLFFHTHAQSHTKYKFPIDYLQEYHRLLLKYGDPVVDYLFGPDGQMMPITASQKQAMRKRPSRNLDDDRDGAINSQVKSARSVRIPDLSDSMRTALSHLKKSKVPMGYMELANVAGVSHGTIRQWCMKGGPLWIHGVRNKGNKQGYHYDKSADLSRRKR
jgi:dipeptidyl aminopeptidase/acylaminoacyl peptidase